MSNKTRSEDFNKLAAAAAEDYDFKNGKNKPGKYRTEADYQASFDDILKFEKTIKNKNDINIVIYHDENNDGIVAAYYAWKYLVFDHKKTVGFLGLKPSHAAKNVINKRIDLDRLKGKNVLILDLSYNKATFDAIRKVAKSMIVIDDHEESTEEGKDIFIGGFHATVAYTFKFFYPKEKVPKVVQYVDDSDRKLFLPFLNFTNLFTTSLGLRYVHKKGRPYGNKLFEELHEFFKTDNVNFWIFIGKYFEEVIDNVKNQIAINAVKRDFQGYKVGVLNFNAPLFTKQVGRQIITNFRNKNEHIDFAVLWGYEYINNAYNVQLVDDHQQTKIKLNKIALELGKIGGHPKGGSGPATGHIGHFYWPGNIWDLFEKKYI